MKIPKILLLVLFCLGCQGAVFAQYSVARVTTLAGTGIMGFADGPAESAKFSYPNSVAVDRNGFIYVADRSNHKIRKISKDGSVSTLAGSGALGYADGISGEAIFNSPEGVAIDKDGNVYVCDTGNHRIRKISPTGNVTTLAG